MAKSLKARIDELIDALGTAEKPTYPQIRARLVKFAALAQELEQGKAIRKAEAKNAALQAQIEKLQSQFDEARSQIQKFRAEEKEREKQEADLPEIQFEILKWLAEGQRRDVSEIANAFNVPIYEADVHLHGLEKEGFINSGYNQYDAVVWESTTKGNQLVLAKRLAGEENAKAKRKHADLTKMQEEVLKSVAYYGDMSCDDFGSDDINEPDHISPDQAEVALYDLEKAGFLKVVGMTDSKEVIYKLDVEGTRYLLERGLL